MTEELKHIQSQSDAITLIAMFILIMLFVISSFVFEKQ